MQNIIYENMQKHSLNLSKYATKDSDVLFLKDYHEDIRTPFFKDIDKILYTLSFVRYMNKTQVFPFSHHDHIQRRMIHVQYVSKIARTIGRALGLNEDLIEAISLGHDLGHPPFGHQGESILNEISLENNEGYFMHNIHSVRMLKSIENYGNGVNVSIQVLDGILCHNGEILKNKYEPVNKSKEEFLKEYENCYKDKKVASEVKPMSLEGCIVRISDVIAYLGRDIEDGIRMKLVTKEDIPLSITSVLGKTNSEIVNTIILDIINNSINKPYILISDNVFKAMNELLDFNRENIYYKSISKENNNKIKLMYQTLYNKYLSDLENHNEDSSIYKSYLSSMSESYKQNNNSRIVIDYLAGMTDDYFIKQYELITENGS